MKYFCLAYNDVGKVGGLSKEEMKAISNACAPYVEDFRRSVSLILVDGLDASSSTVLKPGNCETWVSDGPFLETREQIGGVFLFEARDLNGAIRIAAKHPAARLHGELGWGVEIRPIARIEAGSV